MSSEITKNRKPSHSTDGEGCQQGPENRARGSCSSGGVSEDGTTGRASQISWEICDEESPRAQPLAQGCKAKAGRVGAEVGVPRSSEEPPQSKSGGERRGGTWVNASQSSAGEGDGRKEVARLFDRIGTPPKIQKLQRTLYRKAKAEPKYRFYSLYGELLRPDLIAEAMARVAHNGGTAGIDGEDSSILVKEETREKWKERLLEELRARQYRPSPVRRVYIPKEGSSEKRPLGIPTVKDRVVQAAVALLLLPILEADSHPNSYAYRPKRGAHQAMKAIGQAVVQGRWEVIDADLSGYFDSIPHDRLLQIVSRRISDGAILKLINGWLKAPIVKRERPSGRTQHQDNERGTPQGGVISPLLANAYLNRLDWEVNERCAGKPVMVRYADDFVILSRAGEGGDLLERLKKWLEARGLKLNEKKTRLVDLRQEGIKFLGFEIRGRKSRNRKWYPHVQPHPKSLRKLRDKIREKLNRSTLSCAMEEVVPELNRLLKGWSHYFHYGNSTQTFGQVNRYVAGRLSRWWWRKHACRYGQWNQLTVSELQDRYGLFRLPCTAAWKRTVVEKQCDE